MHRAFFDARVLFDPSWRHWALTIPLLAAGVLGAPWAMAAAMLLCAAMALYYLRRLHSVRPFPVQVRLAYLGWLLTGLFPAMQWMHYFALAGTTAMATVGYCPLARMLSLLAFNRAEPLSLSLVGRTFFSPPDGGLFYRPSAPKAARPSCSCSLDAWAE